LPPRPRAPSFELPSTTGGSVRLDDLVSSGAPLPIFVLEACPTCALALRRLGPIAARLRDAGVGVVVILEDALESLRTTSLLDRDGSVAETVVGWDAVALSALVGHARRAVGAAAPQTTDESPRTRPGCAAKSTHDEEMVARRGRPCTTTRPLQHCSASAINCADLRPGSFTRRHARVCQSMRVPWLTAFLEAALERWSDLGRFGWSAFPARNLRIEERLPIDRQADYVHAIGDPFDRDTWIERHRQYDLEHVACRSAPARRVLPKASRDAWPAPFRALSRGAAPLDLAPDVRLVHVASAFAIASGTRGVSPQDLLDAVVDGDGDFVDAVLENWWRGRASRVIFAALADDVAPALRAVERGDKGWAEKLRNLLGLVHHDPLRDPIAVMLFRYTVAEIPRAEGLREKRPVVAPMALDSGLGQAFYPTSSADVPGRAVDLAAGVSAPVREVLHPCPPFRAQHVVAIGEIAAAVPDLAAARWAHRELVRDAIGPANFAAGIDDDLGS
jgi:hypothetical protein